MVTANASAADALAPPGVRSLVVCFDGGNEVWRRPPEGRPDVVDSFANSGPPSSSTRKDGGGGDGGHWPQGWIQSKSRLLNIDENDGATWECTYHAPRTPGTRGRRAAYHSLEDVRAFLERYRRKNEKGREKKRATPAAVTQSSQLNGDARGGKRRTASSNAIPAAPPARTRRRSGRKRPAVDYLESADAWECNVGGIAATAAGTTIAARASDGMASQLGGGIISGTDRNLRVILDRGDPYSEAMHRSVLCAAVLAQKSGRLYAGDSSFVGADGRTYPDLRSAFRHVAVKPCSICKKRVQGAFFCRLKMMHFDAPDWDGGRSAEDLEGLCRLSVEELKAEEGVCSVAGSAPWERYYAEFSTTGSTPGTLLLGERKTTGIDAPISDGGESPHHGWSMDQFSDDLLYHVASYVQTLRTLAVFCQTSKRSHRLLHHSVHSEPLFRDMYVRSFGAGRGANEYSVCGPDAVGWRERWETIRGIRRGLGLRNDESGDGDGIGDGDSGGDANRLSHPDDDPRAAGGKSERRLRATLGVLTPQEEREAILYDNPLAETDAATANDRALCIGYFGMDVLPLPPPPLTPSRANMGDSDPETPLWRRPVVLRGDFAGVRIFDSLEGAAFERERRFGGDARYADTPLPPAGNQNQNQNDDEGRGRYRSVGENDGGRQVLALLACPPSLHRTEEEEENVYGGGVSKKKKEKPCFFLGYASGSIAAVIATPSEGGYNFSMGSSKQSHTDEVTALAIVDGGGYAPSSGRPFLASACCGGKVK